MATIKNKIIKNFFSPDELDLLQRFSRNKLDQNVDWIIDDQSFSPAWYDDPLMNGVLYSKLKRVEHESNLNLIPTYSYWRYYVFGGELGKHTDRPSCEVSVTACIKKYDDWPIIVGTLFYMMVLDKSIGDQAHTKAKVKRKYFFIM